MTIMYDADTPPETFVAGIPWGGYLDSPDAAAPWPLEKLKAALAVGLLPIWVSPLTSGGFYGSKAIADAQNACAQVRKIGGDSLVVALDTEERAYEAAPSKALMYAVRFGRQVEKEGGIIVFYGSKTFLAALRKLIKTGLAWLAEYTEPTKEFPVAGWPKPRGWQYAADQEHAGKKVDLSRIEDGFPLIRAVKPEKATPLTLRARHAARVLAKHLEHRTHAVKADKGDRNLLKTVEEQCTEALARKAT